MPGQRRVVSKSEYAVYFTQITALTLSETLLFLLGAISGICTIALACAAIYCWFIYAEPAVFESYAFSIGFYASILAVLSGGGAWGLFKLAAAAGDKCAAIEPVEPMTRQNIEQLSAEETLVRASQEPPVAQEKILLRAASASEETKPEELLRPLL